MNLTNAAPNTTYEVRLIELPQSGSSCPPNPATGVFGGTLQTDASGNGQVNVQGPLLSGKTGAFVDLNNTTAPDTDYYHVNISDFQRLGVAPIRYTVPPRICPAAHGRA